MDIGVAVGDGPLGPFRDAKGGPLVSDGTPNSSGLDIDPTVFTDDDGQTYLYRGGNFRRSVAVDLLHFNADGTIREVVQTTTGPPPNPGGGGNIAPASTASTSHVSAWESLAALNNGGTPANSADRSNLAYGNWPQRGTRWVEYTWPTARAVNRSSVYWFDDGQGIDLPASRQVQYRTGSAYAPVPGQSACGVAGDTSNTTTFTAVTTTRLRLSITSKPDSSTGVLEWQAFAA
ncbi:hypothetical protein ACFV4N_37360 [Actinosynnema sp. NPDC059797]